MDELVRKYALINAVEHDGKAIAKSILGKLLADYPELRSKVLELNSKIEEEINEINYWSREKQKEELEKLGGYAPTARIEKKGLPELDLSREKFTVRFAPNPDGALHLGNARPAVLCDDYARKYNGKFILRFDDTDPKVKIPEKIFYKWIREDLKWLKITWNQEIIASRRLNIYYKYAEKLIRLGKAYVCTCGEEWKKLRDKSQPCSCRNDQNQIKRWKKMLKHGYKEGQAVLRVKTDLDAKNPAVRDWAAMRIVDKPHHPFSKKKVWPLYNFASAIDDRLCKITHIFRGQEHATNEVKQRFLYEHFKWEYPDVVILGRFSLSDSVLSKSATREGIANGEYSGWDDLKIGTLRALRRRGYQTEAIRQIITEIGPKPSDITISMENLSAYNRKAIDKSANRYFFIPNPKRIEIKNMTIKKTKIAMHPEYKRGYRNFKIGKIFYIDSKDFDKYKGLEVRLKDLCNINLNEKSTFTGVELKPVPKIQWVPEKHIEVRVLLPRKEIKGYGELNLARAKIGEIVQLERFGFVKIEKKSKSNIIAVFAHE
ncbi:MAG: glutamate--tRNA ligase [Candidatus Aenigmatarchaeota archaeon]